MVGTIYITRELKDYIENYLFSQDISLEYGGFFLGKDNKLIIPRILPNHSKTPYNSYLTPNYWRELIKIDLEFYELDFYVHFHSHPNHSIYSKQDLKVANYKTYSDYSIDLLIDKENKSYTWRGYDSNYEEYYIHFIDETYDKFKTYFAKSLNLIELNDIFLTDSGEMVSGNPLSKVMLTVDSDSLIMYKYLKELSKQWSPCLPSYNRLSEILGYSVNRVKKALAKCRGLFPKIDKY